jgi:copper chaperone CopZ
MDKTNIENLPREALVMEKANIGIAGMTSDDAVRRAERALRELDGVKEVVVDRDAAVIRVTFDSSIVDIPSIHDAILQSGYKPVAERVS